MDPILLVLTVGGAFSIVLLVIGIVITARSERSFVEERLGKLLEDEALIEAKKRKAEERATPVGDWLQRRLEKSRLGGGVARELARADLKLKPVEYFALIVISMLLTGAFAYFVFDRDNKIKIFTAIGIIVGFFLPRMYVHYQQSRRLIRFNDQLADMLNLMVNGLRAGYSTNQAMEAVSKELPPPISDEFRRVVQEMQLGLPMEEALDNLLRRIPSDDLDLVITAMTIQREVGGNLAEILDTISYTIRERVRIKGEIRVLTAQVMISGRFLAAMPLFIFAALYLLNRPYMMQFFVPETRLFGIIALSIGGLMILAGMFVMTKIATIEV